MHPSHRHPLYHRCLVNGMIEDFVKQSLIDMIRSSTYFCHHLLPLPHLLRRPLLLRCRDHQSLHELYGFSYIGYHNITSIYVFTVVIDVRLAVVGFFRLIFLSWSNRPFGRRLLARITCLNRVPKHSVQIVRIIIY